MIDAGHPADQSLDGLVRRDRRREPALARTASRRSTRRRRRRSRGSTTPSTRPTPFDDASSKPANPPRPPVYMNPTIVTETFTIGRVCTTSNTNHSSVKIVTSANTNGNANSARLYRERDDRERAEQADQRRRGGNPACAGAVNSSNVQTTTITVASTIVASVPALRQSSASAAMPEPGDDPDEHVGPVPAGSARVVGAWRRARSRVRARAAAPAPAAGAERTRRAATSRSKATSSSSGGSFARPQRDLVRRARRRGPGRSPARPRPSRSRRCGNAVRRSPRRSASASSSPKIDRDLAGGGLAPVRQPLGRGRGLASASSGARVSNPPSGSAVRRRARRRRLDEVGVLRRRLVGRRWGAALGSAGSSGPGRAAGPGGPARRRTRGSESAIRRPARPESSFACASSAPMIRTPSPAGAGAPWDVPRLSIFVVTVRHRSFPLGPKALR